MEENKHNDLIYLIPSASETLSTTSKNEELEKQIQKVVKDINKAKQAGKRRILFNVYDDHEPILKELFQKQGYKFCPTGYCGGVWQRSIDIYW